MKNYPLPQHIFDIRVRNVVFPHSAHKDDIFIRGGKLTQYVLYENSTFFLLDQKEIIYFLYIMAMNNSNHCYQLNDLTLKYHICDITYLF